MFAHKHAFQNEALYDMHLFMMYLMRSMHLSFPSLSLTPNDQVQTKKVMQIQCNSKKYSASFGEWN
jgi:hypothetical protein